MSSVRARGWFSVLTLPRELSLSSNKACLLSQPLRDLVRLRRRVATLAESLPLPISSSSLGRDFQLHGLAPDQVGCSFCCYCFDVLALCSMAHAARTRRGLEVRPPSPKPQSSGRRRHRRWCPRDATPPTTAGGSRWHSTRRRRRFDALRRSFEFLQQGRRQQIDLRRASSP